MITKSRVARVIVPALAAILAVNAAALAQSPLLGIDVFQDGTWVWGIDQQGTNADGGTVYNYQGGTNGGNWGMDWDVDGDSDPFIIAGAAFQNLSAVPQNFAVTFVLPTIPLAGPTLTGGSASFSMTSDGDGGQVSTVPGSAIYTALIDGADFETLFDDPFTTGPQPPGASPVFGPQSFGDPVFPPTFPGPAVTSDIGIRFEFTLSPGDVVTLNGIFNVIPEPGTFALVGLAGLALLRRRPRA